MTYYKGLQLCFSTLPCMNYNAEQLISYCKKYNIGGVEIRLDDNDSVCGFSRKDDLISFSNTFKKSGVEITNLGTSVCLKKYDEAQIDKAVNCIDKAEAVSAKAIRVFLGNFAVKYSIKKDPLDYDGIIRALQKICLYAKKKNIEIWVETHNEFATGSKLSKLIQDVNRDNLKIIWDVIHPIEDGEPPEETLRLLGQKIAHIHIKDGINREDEEWHDYKYTLLGQGDVPIVHIINLLKANEFKGSLSLEWESLWRDELKQYPDDMDFLLGEFTGLIRKAELNLIKGFESDSWFTWTPGGVQTPKFYKHNTKALIETEENSYQYGKWCTVVNDICGNDTYYFEVLYRADGVTCEQVSVSAILTWCDKSGNWIQRDYVDNLEREESYTKLFTTVKSPNGTDNVLVELVLKWQGRVEWRNPYLERTEGYDERNVKVATAYIQYAHTVEENTQKVLQAIDNASSCKPDLICLGETLFDRGTNLPLNLTADTIPGKYSGLLGEKAAKYKTYICYSIHETDGKHYYTTAVLLDRNGKISGKYRKTHLALIEGERGIIPGNDYPVFDTDFGKVGILICWDHYFPEPARQLRLNGAELVVVSTAGDAPIQSLSRAVENGVYIAVAGVDTENKYGLLPSRIINPKGEVIAQTDNDLGFAVAEINLNERHYKYWLSVGAAYGEGRSIYIKERRPDTYSY